MDLSMQRCVLLGAKADQRITNEKLANALGLHPNSVTKFLKKPIEEWEIRHFLKFCELVGYIGDVEITHNYSIKKEKPTSKNAHRR